MRNTDTIGKTGVADLPIGDRPAETEQFSSAEAIKILNKWDKMFGTPIRPETRKFLLRMLTTLSYDAKTKAKWLRGTK